MADHSKIEWLRGPDGQQGDTWNPITGCTVVGPGCANCYAMTLAGTRMKHTPSRQGLTKPSKSGPIWTGEVRFNREWLDQPLRKKKPRRIFPVAHGDLFHEAVPDEWLLNIFAVMWLAPQHTFLVLTKRPARARNFLNDPITPDRIRETGLKLWPDLAAKALAQSGGLMPWPLPKVQLGTSIENADVAGERLYELLHTMAAVRWVSAEPLLSAVDFTRVKIFFDYRNTLCTLNALTGSVHLDFPNHTEEESWAKLDMIVVGGEAIKGRPTFARPMHPDWVRSIRDQCAAAGTAFFFKQWGDWAPGVDPAGIEFGTTRWVNLDGTPEVVQPDSYPAAAEATLMRYIGKTKAGNHLDLRQHLEYA